MKPRRFARTYIHTYIHTYNTNLLLRLGSKLRSNASASYLGRELREPDCGCPGPRFALASSAGRGSSLVFSPKAGRSSSTLPLCPFFLARFDGHFLVTIRCIGH